MRIGRDGSPSNNKAIPSGVVLGQLALNGLLAKFDVEGDWERYRAHPVGEPPRSACKVCLDLLMAAKQIGQAIAAEPAPNNQFALYNLYIARLLPNLARQAIRAAADDLEADNGQRKEDKDSVNRLSTGIDKLLNEMATLAAYVEPNVEGNDTSAISSLTKYFTRASWDMKKHEHYGIALFFLISIAASAGHDVGQDKVLIGSPAIYNIFLEAQAALTSADAKPELISKKVVEAIGRGRFALKSKIYLGGLLEAGATDITHLWKPLFGEDPQDHDRLSSRDSAEAHYISYRLTSSEENAEVVKSFLVFQAPGYVLGGKSRRDHFAVKAFTKYDTEMMRSVGAVVGLGNEIVGFASRRKQQPFSTEPDLPRSSDFRGATMLIFSQNWFTNDIAEVQGILLGMLLTTNQKGRNTACPIMCLRSNATHSDQAGLGVISGNDLVEDILKYTRLAAGADSDAAAMQRYIWSTLLLARPATNVKVGADPHGDSEWIGYPPIVAPDLTPRGLMKKLSAFGYEMLKMPSDGAA